MTKIQTENLVVKTISDIAREAILRGLSNVETACVLAIAGLDEAKARRYPAWYRAEMVRKYSVPAVVAGYVAA